VRYDDKGKVFASTFETTEKNLIGEMRKGCICENNEENLGSSGGSRRGSRGKHQTRSLKASERDVDPVAVLEPDLALPAPVDDLLPEAEYPFRWLLGAHVVRAKAEIPNETKVGEGVLPEEGVDLFDQREERGVQVVVVGKVGVKETGVDVADGNELKSGVGRE